MKKLKDLSIIIVTYRTNNKILLKCIKSINTKVSIYIIENSKKNISKNQIVKKFPNCKIFFTGKNLGFGSATNWGIDKIKTNYVLSINPDMILNKNFFKNLKKYLDKKENFAIITSSNPYESLRHTYGFFDNNKTNFKNEKHQKDLIKVDWASGCCFLINLKKFKQKKIFDSNIFLYFEDWDLFQKTKKNNQNVFLSTKLIAKHLGNKSSFLSDTEYLYDYLKLRNWHWGWSFFYYYKKNYNYFYALTKSSSKLFKSFIKSILFFLLFNKKEFISNLYQVKGLFNSIIGKKSFYRLKI